MNIVLVIFLSLKSLCFVMFCFLNFVVEFGIFFFFFLVENVL
jgi:hypothetical protein